MKTQLSRYIIHLLPTIHIRKYNLILENQNNELIIKVLTIKINFVVYKNETDFLTKVSFYNLHL